MALSSMRESPNSRRLAIKKFLGQVPPGATRLRLLVADTPPLPLGEWAPAQMGEPRDLLADEIEELMVDHASNGMRRYRANYMLAWCGDDGAQITVKQMSVYSHQLRDESSPEDMVRELDGSALSQVSQAQRHLEAMMRLNIQAQQQIVSVMSVTIDRLSERCVQMEAASGQRHDQLLEAKETILGLLNEAASDELSPVQMKALEIAQQLAPAVAVWFQAQAAAKKAEPPKSQPQSNGKAAA